MGTTTLTVELLIIGYQALIWLGLAVCLSITCDGSLLSALKEWKEFIAVTSVVAAYTSGAIMNGVAGKLMERLEGKWVFTEDLRPSEMRAAILVQKPEAFVHVMKNINEPRVLRSTILNIFFIGFFASIHLYNSSTFTWPKFLVIVATFLIGTGLTLWAWFETDENYYIHLWQTFKALSKPATSPGTSIGTVVTSSDHKHSHKGTTMTLTKTPTSFTDSDYVELSHVFAGGDISKASKPELERFAVMLSRPNAFTHFGASGFPQLCDTVRLLILVRISEEANREASRMSTIALVIATVALVVSLVQTFAALR